MQPFRAPLWTLDSSDIFFDESLLVISLLGSWAKIPISRCPLQWSIFPGKGRNFPLFQAVLSSSSVDPIERTYDRGDFIFVWNCSPYIAVICLFIDEIPPDVIVKEVSFPSPSVCQTIKRQATASSMFPMSDRLFLYQK